MLPVSLGGDHATVSSVPVCFENNTSVGCLGGRPEPPSIVISLEYVPNSGALSFRHRTRAGYLRRVCKPVNVDPTGRFKRSVAAKSTVLLIPI